MRSKMVCVYAHATIRHDICIPHRRRVHHHMFLRGGRCPREDEDLVGSYHEIENDTHRPHIGCARVICAHFAHRIAAVDELNVRFRFPAVHVTHTHTRGTFGAFIGRGEERTQHIEGHEMDIHNFTY